jgi:hypothetical protein
MFSNLVNFNGVKNNVGICYLTNFRQNAETVISTTPGIAHS